MTRRVSGGRLSPWRVALLAASLARPALVSAAGWGFFDALGFCRTIAADAINRQGDAGNGRGDPADASLATKGGSMAKGKKRRWTRHRLRCGQSLLHSRVQARPVPPGLRHGGAAARSDRRRVGDGLKRRHGHDPRAHQAQQEYAPRRRPLACRATVSSSKRYRCR